MKALPSSYCWVSDMKPFESRPRRKQTRRSQSLAARNWRLEPRVLLASGNGLWAQYFDTADLTTPVATQLDSEINFDWGSGSPGSGIGSDNFSARWTGQVEAQFTETYSFIVNANDGARLWVNGQLLIDQFTQGSLADETATIDLIAGRKYDIQLEYLEVTGDASLKLEWSSVSLPLEVVPTDQLHASHRGSVLVEQWNGLSGSSVADLTGSADYPNNPDSSSSLTLLEATSLGDNFGQRIRGYIHAPVTGPYTFFIAGDEAAELWLSNSGDAAAANLIAHVDSATSLRQWTASATQESNRIFLAAGQKYYFEVLHKEAAGADHVSVGWIAPGESDPVVVEGEHLSPVLPEVRIFSENPSFSESSINGAQFSIVRSGASMANSLDVEYDLSGTAVNGTDYQTLSGTVTIPAGSDSTLLTVSSLSDSFVEGDETLILELAAGTGYMVGHIGERTANGTLQDDTQVQSGGISLWDGQALSDFTRFGGTYTTESDPIHGDVIQAVIPGNVASQFSAQLKQDIDQPVEVGDIIYVEFRAKAIGTPGKLAAIFERASSPFTKSLSQGIPIDTQWQRIQIPFSAAESYAIGEASFGFHLGFQGQTLQFTDFNVLNFGQPKSLAPETAFGLNNISGTWGTSQNVQVDGQPFTFAYEVETTTVPAQTWHLQALEKNEGRVNDGDTMRFEFSIRATAGANPEASFVVQRTDTYATLFSQSIALTNDWQDFSFDVVVTEDFDVQGLQGVFNLGFGLQTVEIGGFFWTNENNNADIDDLPEQFPAATYLGRGATDSWRADADARIESDRKRQLTVNVTDTSGQPLDGAVVSIRQNRHEFIFGSAINAYGGKLDPNGNATAVKYQALIKRLFNGVVMENSHKWPGMLQDRARAIAGMDFAVANDIELRGHNIIWPSRTFMPDSIWAEYDSREANDGTASANAWLTTTIEDRFDDVLTTFDGVIGEWDVVNEPWSNHDVMDLLGDDIVVDWYQRVRDYDPDIKLVLNDFGIFPRNGGDAGHRANFEYWLSLLNDEGLLDVIGEQSHYTDASLTDIEVFGQLVNTYNTQFNKPVAITEFDLDSKDEQLQADYLRDYMTMAFSQPAISEFLHWGFWQSSHWLPDAALYRSDFSIKPNGQAYEDLVFGQWWSDVQGTTLAGEVNAQVFKGDYDVVVQYDGQTYTATITVDDSGAASLTIPVQQVAPTVESVVINGGDIQRSMVREIAVTFSEVVFFDSGAFEVQNLDTGGLVSVDVMSRVIDGKTFATLTFSGSGTLNGSPVDGNYRLISSASIIDGVGNPLDGDGDGTAGDDRMDDFFRFFGDNNGNRIINAFDLLDFRHSYGQSGTYNADFDYNGDGFINAFDLLQFRFRYRTSI